MLTDLIGKEIEIDYTNWQGVRAWRRIIPKRLDYGANELRSPGPHVRGCWCVDLLLGRE